MTTPTPHGQVPEALIDLIDEYAETRHRCGGIYNARTEAARKAVIEALSGVQALSAAPAVDITTAGEMQAFEAWYKQDCVIEGAAAKMAAKAAWKARAMLAASPTPPAEQQAAPKAAPTRTALPEGWTDCTIEFGNDGPEVVAYGPKRMMTRLAKWLGKYFAQVIADAATKAAPQQEAQKPYAYAVYFPDQPKVELVHDLDELIDDLTNRPHAVTPLYEAPQPAPAPLSEMPYEKRKAIQEGEQISASDAWFKARHEMLDTVDRRNVFRAGFDRGWNAALAAQKDTP